MAKLIPPHGGKGLTCCLLEGAELDAEKKKAEGLKKITISHREVGDLIMMGIGGFSPLTGFMTKADWKGVCENFQLADGTFWPIPVTLSASKEDADSISEGDEIALCDPDTDEVMGTMTVTEKYEMTEADKKFECEKNYMGEGTPTVEEFWKIAGEDHPGVLMVMAQKEFNFAGPVKVLSEGEYPTKYAGVYMRPEESRKIFEEKGWSEIAALQLRNPMHRSHEYLCKIAVEVCDGVYIHSLVGNLKPGDIPAEVRVECIDSLVKNYFVDKNVVQGGYPLDMRYAGPREGLLHATFRQNYGCSRMIIGRDHAGVGDFYGMFEAQTIFDKIPTSDDPGKTLLCQPLKIDWTFYCYKCDGMASLRTCPHGKDDRVLLSGTMLRKMLSEGQELPDHFGRDEVVAILRKYYEGLTEKVEIKMHSAATGDSKK
ncbi:MAG: sulfate adenylyltransferase [Deltaproteobacteria bacterium]|jgi:sulfate adenylyltransferase|nr:sulfate adenylyltransferase [Deltaproteobacteria bacterium]MBW2239659.1 sulfate adenylyltransferase [Deltaproteobacteria bacterium]